MDQREARAQLDLLERQDRLETELVRLDLLDQQENQGQQERQGQRQNLPDPQGPKDLRPMEKRDRLEKPLAQRGRLDPPVVTCWTGR